MRGAVAYGDPDRRKGRAFLADHFKHCEDANNNSLTLSLSLSLSSLS